MKILHIAFSGLGGHGNVFFSMADADKENQHQFEIIFFGNEEVREGYIQKAKQRNIPWYFVKKKLENLKAAVALHLAYYNFCWMHGTLKTTPAVAAGLADRPWKLHELLECAGVLEPDRFYY